jgi:acyl dehydratase
MSSKIDVEAHENTVGKTRGFDIGPITRRQVRRYARAVEDDNPLFHDVEYAQSAGYEDLVVPPNFVPAIIESGEGVRAHTLRGDGLDPTRYPIEIPAKSRLIGGGQELTFGRYLTAGESVRGEETLDDLYQKEGSSMGTMTLMEMTVEYFADDERVIRCEKTTIVVDRQ